MLFGLLAVLSSGCALRHLPIDCRFPGLGCAPDKQCVDVGSAYQCEPLPPQPVCKADAQCDCWEPDDVIERTWRFRECPKPEPPAPEPPKPEPPAPPSPEPPAPEPPKPEPPAPPTPEPPAPEPPPDGPPPLVGRNYPKPPEGVCPAWYPKKADFYGIALLNVVPVKTQGGKYLGKRYVVHATPKVHPPFCGHRPDDPDKCESWQPCQQEKVAFSISLAGHFENHRCDQQSDNQMICHHKAEGPNGESGKGAQIGPTKFCVFPASEGPSSPRGSCIVVPVR